MEQWQPTTRQSFSSIQGRNSFIITSKLLIIDGSSSASSSSVGSDRAWRIPHQQLYQILTSRHTSFSWISAVSQRFVHKSVHKPDRTPAQILIE
jgi:hypothetical protein